MDTKDKQLIVGAGLSGVLTAKAFQSQDVPYAVYESSGVAGGVWTPENKEFGLVNESSSVQIDAVVFRSLDDQSPVLVDSKDLLVNTRRSANDVMRGIKDDLKALKGPVVFNRKVLSWSYDESTDHVLVESQDVLSGAKFSEVFAGIHLRTGSLASPNKVEFTGQDKFKGRIVTGTKSDITLDEFQDQNVVILGWGAFSIENARRALIGGAKSITIVSRNRKHHHFEYPNYLLSVGLYNLKAAEPAHVAETWAKIFEANRKAAKSLGVQDLLFNEETCVTLYGREHMIVRNGFHCSSIDMVMMGIHYGLVRYIPGTVTELYEAGVVTEDGTKIPADVIVKTFGFKTDLRLQKGHSRMNCFWIDGRPNTTASESIDSVKGAQIFGPMFPGRHIILVSYYVLQEFGEVIAYFLKNKDKFVEFSSNPLFSTLSTPESLDLFHIFSALNKIFASGNPELIQIVATSMVRKQDQYSRLLDHKTFLNADKNKWELLIDFFVKKTGQPRIPYPFEEDLKLANKV